MNETIRTIFERRSVRKYKDTPLTPADIEFLIDAGRMAPSAMNKQPLKFYVLSHKADISSFSKEIMSGGLKGIREMKVKDALKMTLGLFHFSAIKDMLFQRDHVFYEAPAVIIITTPKEDEWATLDAGMCAQNIMLAAKSMGFDSCPVGFGRYIMQTKDYHLLSIPDSEKVELAISVGYGAQQPETPERRKDNLFFVSITETNVSF